MPFFAQERYQCGPAALATTLVYSGVATTPEAMVPLVYTPGRKGSFQAELKAATRGAGRLPYELDGSFESVLYELEAGRPVLVMQNLGLSWLPKWHYSVVVGYDPVANRVILRSGTHERFAVDIERFLYSWRLADNWAMVILRPGELPASGSAGQYIEMLAAAERRFDSAAMDAAIATALRAWPTNADLLFAAATHAHFNKAAITAGERYRAALVADPTHAGAMNNYADLLRSEDCLASALAQSIAARRAVATDSPIYPTLQKTADEIKAAAREKSLRDSGSLCAELTATAD